ncbi:MAG: DEAD/DEAH box helicase [Myxococcales bacterium]|nr:DEAD/DEAH box helicase [Myxococcales bacterium]
MSIDPALARLAQIIKRKCNVLAYREGESLAKGALLSRRDEDEVVVVVPAPYFEVAPTVSLCPGSSEWSCDCGGELDPCAHVAAASIAVTTERADAAAMPTLAQKSASLEYRWSVDPKDPSKLLLKRFVSSPDGRSIEVDSLAASQGALDGATLVTRDDDRSIDRALAHEPLERMSEASIEQLFVHLARAQHVYFGDEKIAVSHEPLAPSAKVTAKDRGWRLVIERPEGALAVYAPGVVRTREGVAPLRGTNLLGRAGERAPIDRVFEARDTVELVAKVLPELDRTVVWKHRASGLPNLKTGAKPRVSFEVSHGQRALEVRPWIVYGDPPSARVEAGRLVWIGGDVVVRDEAAEVSLGHKLRDELGLIPGRAVTYEGEDAGRFLKAMRAFDERSGGASRIDRRKLVASLRVSDDDVEVLFTVEEQGEGAKDKTQKRASAESVLRAWESGLDVVALEGGGFAPIPSAWLAKNGALVAQLLAAREGDEKVSPAAAPAVIALCERLESPPPPSFAKLRPLVDGIESVPRARLPKDLAASLRPYQQTGVDWLCFLRDASLGAILADDMGLGKTLQCLASLRAREERASDDDDRAMGALVVCPRSLVHNWAEECARFRPGLKVSVYHGESRELDPSADVTITTYAILRLDEDELRQKRWDTVVLDEAQNIKNPDSRAARASFALEARARIALSGTPIENKLDELWSIMHFANPGLLGGRSAFDERVARKVSEGDTKALSELRARIRPFVLRRRKSAVLTELPPRTDVVLHCELDAHERAVYDAIRAASLSGVVKALREGSDVMQALELLLRLRQASCHAGLVPGQRDPSDGWESSKVTALCEALEEAVGAGHKALVFSQWTSLLDRVEPALKSRSIAFTRLDGATRDRAAVVKDFQREDGPPVLLASLKAGGTGLNLTAADHVFLLDPWWNPATEEQAADRAHRMGQRNAVTVYRLVAKDTVEERILALQATKRALADAALDEGTLGAALTKDDLLALLDG